MMEYIESRYDQFVKDLETIVNMDSATENTAGTLEVARFLEARFKAIGMETEISLQGEDEIPCLMARTAPKNGRYDFMFLGHMDTVFPTGEAARRPFSIVDGKAMGPGTCDMKAGLLGALYVCETLHHTGELGDIAICVTFNGDEEAGTTNSRPWIVSAAKQCDRVLVFEPCRPEFRFVLHRKGGGWFIVTTRGRSAHAGADPEKGANAVVDLAHHVLKITELNDAEAETSAQVTMVKGGTGVNIIPDEAVAEIDVRVKTMTEMKRVEKFFAEYPQEGVVPGVTVEVTGGFERPPLEPCDGSRAIFERIVRAGQSLGLEPASISTGGCSDGNFTAAMDIPTIDGMGPVGANSHSVDEYVELASIVPIIHMVTTVCREEVEG